jgi:beta-lactam-binding protein with PASTA domain
MTKTLRGLMRGPSLRLLVAAAAIFLLAGRESVRLNLLAAENPIVVENRQTGDTDWDVNGAGDSSIQGFATDISVNQGETISFKVNTDASDYTIDVYRLGFYGDAGARKMTATPISVHDTQPQPDCLTDNATGLHDCGNWHVSASWSTTGAVSGIYVAKLTRIDSGGSSHMVFVVRDDARQADVLVQTSDTTWQAYNQYGGGSMYCGGPVSNAGTAYECPGRVTKVSYNRPIDTRGHDPQSFLFNAEYPMVRFLEANGYDVKYWAGVDTDRRGAELVGAHKPKAFFSVGHDEYWSGEQRARVEEARNAGVNLAFFSGNEMFWKTRYEPSIDASNTAFRTLVSYKETLAGTKIDPALNGAGQPIWTGTWRDPRFSPPADGGRPENGLIGQIWTVNSGTSAITVPAAMANLRLWQHTRVAALTAGDVATLSPESLGYEWDEDLDNGSRPGGVIHLSSTTVPGVEKIVDYGSMVGTGTATHNLTLYRHNSGALVFGAGTVQWSWGLDGDHDRGVPAAHVPDQAMQQATITLLADMGAQPGSLQPGADPALPLMAISASSDTFAPMSIITSPAAGGQVEGGSQATISGTATETGGGVVASVEVSVDGGATWHVASGTTTWTFNWSTGAPGSATIRSRAIDDSGNVEAAGAGITVTVFVGDCPCTSLWPPSAVPNPSIADANPYELGVKFQSDIAGSITGIRFYKGPANTGTHLGNLWAANGTLLATAVFANETASGWQQVSFETSVAITANTTYIASYHTDVGGYSADVNYFATTGVDSSPLHAPSSNASGGNGVFSPGASAFPTGTFNATNYWVDVVFAPIASDPTPPTISAVTATAIDTGRVTVTWSTSEPATSRIDYSMNPAILTDTTLPPGTLTVINGSFGTQHSVTLVGLLPNTTYYYRITAADHAGNAAIVAAPAFTVPDLALRDTVATDFAAGTGTGTYVSQTADGELILAPTAGSEFTGPALPAGWIDVPFGSASSISFQNGRVVADGARVAACVTDTGGVCLPGETTSTTPSAIFTAPHSLEFSASFSGDPFQHAGLAVAFGSASEPWAIFSTGVGGQLYARTNTGAGDATTDLGITLLGAFHRYRIDWQSDSVNYYVDGLLVASHALAIAGSMRPVAGSDFNALGGTVSVDWMRMSPYANTGTFASRVLAAPSPVQWHSIQWVVTAPLGTSVAISVRTGNTPTPDGSWSAFIPVAAPGPLNLLSQYIQYQAVMTSTDPNQTPALEDLIISAHHAPVGVPNVVGQTQAAATSAITATGLTVGMVTSASSATVAAGSVIGVSPAAGSSAAWGSAVNLVLSSGPVVVSVPNVVGLTQAAATSAIAAAGLTLGTVTTASSATVAVGRVVNESPAAGTSVSAGSAVNLVVSSGPAPVNVPNVVGQTQAAAASAIAAGGLTLGTVTLAPSATVAAGRVISESPAAGASAAAGSAVNFVVSSGQAPVNVPNVVGQTQAAAASAITVAGLTLGTVTSAPSATVVAGRVISESPAAGTSVAAGSGVTLVVSSGPASMSVPNVVGLTQVAATSAITAAGLTVGAVSTAASGTVPMGSVISESPAAGTSVAAGSGVTLVVSSGPAPVSVPNVVGLTQVAATSAITAAGLTVGTVTTASSATVPEGSVISESPAAGTSVAAGSAVNLTISAGENIANLKHVADFDGDGKADLNVYRPSTGTWYNLRSSTHYTTFGMVQWGLPGDIPVSGDYDGDGTTDLAVFRPANGTWYIRQSSTNFTTSVAYQWGLPGDVPVPGDYDGDGKTDLVIFRPATGTWYIRQSSTNFTTSVLYQWGLAGDITIAGDYDGDGLTDLAVYRPTTGMWYIRLSTTGYATSVQYQWGLIGDITVPGDYDGDGKTDLAIYRTVTGEWHIRQSSTAYTTAVTYQWGLSEDVPVPSDFDGDGKTDIAVFRPSIGVWFLLLSNTNFTTSAAYQWGLPGDIPILNRH